MVNLCGDKTDETLNKSLVKKLRGYDEMTLKEYESIPFNNKVLFGEGVICRMWASSFGIGQLATYYKCDKFDNGTPKLTPVQVWLI